MSDFKTKKQPRSPWKNLVKKAKREATMARGQYRFDNMPKDEKEDYLNKFGPAPKDDAKRRIWAAQLPGQKPYEPKNQKKAA